MSETPGPGPAPRPDPPVEGQGGDPACWLSRVCPECGLFLEDDVFTDAAAPICPRCGSPVHAP